MTSTQQRGLDDRRPYEKAVPIASPSDGRTSLLEIDIVLQILLDVRSAREERPLAGFLLSCSSGRQQPASRLLLFVESRDKLSNDLGALSQFVVNDYFASQ